MPIDFTVTRRAISLGTADSTTGWYAKSYAETSIEMIILHKSASFLALQAGVFSRWDVTGLTADTVAVYDQIKDSSGKYYEVLSVEEVWLGNSFMWRICELNALPFGYES